MSSQSCTLITVVYNIYYKVYSLLLLFIIFPAILTFLFIFCIQYFGTIMISPKFPWYFSWNHINFYHLFNILFLSKNKLSLSIYSCPSIEFLNCSLYWFYKLLNDQKILILAFSCFYTRNPLHILYISIDKYYVIPTIFSQYSWIFQIQQSYHLQMMIDLT